MDQDQERSNQIQVEINLISLINTQNMLNGLLMRVRTNLHTLICMVVDRIKRSRGSDQIGGLKSI